MLKITKTVSCDSRSEMKLAKAKACRVHHQLFSQYGG